MNKATNCFSKIHIRRQSYIVCQTVIIKTNFTKYYSNDTWSVMLAWASSSSPSGHLSALLPQTPSTPTSYLMHKERYHLWESTSFINHVTCKYRLISVDPGLKMLIVAHKTIWICGYKPKAMVLQPKKKKNDSRPHRWHIPVILALGKQKEEDQEFKVIFGYTVSSRLAWATKDLSLVFFSPPPPSSFSRQGFSV